MNFAYKRTNGFAYHWDDRYKDEVFKGSVVTGYGNGTPVDPATDDVVITLYQNIWQFLCLKSNYLKIINYILVWIDFASKRILYLSCLKLFKCHDLNTLNINTRDVASGNDDLHKNTLKCIVVVIRRTRK